MMLRHPIWLLALLLVPAWVYVRYSQLQRPSAGHSNGPLIGRVPPSWRIILQPLLPALYALALVCLVVAMARPQTGLEESRVRTEAVDIVLLTDVSTSMLGEDMVDRRMGKRLNRLDAAKEVLRRFIQARTHDRLALIAFAAMPYTVAPLTLDHAWLLQQVERLQCGMVEDGTAIGDGVASAVNRLRDSQAKSKVIILLTDGINNRGRLAPLDAARLAKELGIKIYTVGAGKTGLVPYPVRDPFGRKFYTYEPSEIDEATLTKIAELTGARYFRADDFDSLRKTYEEIDRMEKTELEVEHYTRFEERCTTWLALALVSLIAEKLLSVSRVGRVP